MASQEQNSHSLEFPAPASESQDSSMSDTDDDSNDEAPAPAQVLEAPTPAQVLEYVSTESEEDWTDAPELDDNATVYAWTYGSDVGYYTETDSLIYSQSSDFSADDSMDTESSDAHTDPDWEIQVEADALVFAVPQQMHAQQMDAMDAQQNPPP